MLLVDESEGHPHGKLPEPRAKERALHVITVRTDHAEQQIAAGHSHQAAYNEKPHRPELLQQAEQDREYEIQLKQ